MILQRIGRYTISQTSDGVVIEMTQGWQSLGFSLVCATALAASWWYGPFGPHPTRGFDGRFYGLLTGVLLVFIVLGMLGALYRERWLITSTRITQTSSWSTKPREIVRPNPLTVQLGIARDNDGDLQMLPYRAYLMDAQGDRTGLEFQFDQSGHVDQWLRTLRPILSFEVDDQRRPSRRRSV